MDEIVVGRSLFEPVGPGFPIVMVAVLDSSDEVGGNARPRKVLWAICPVSNGSAAMSSSFIVVPGLRTTTPANRPPTSEKGPIPGPWLTGWEAVGEVQLRREGSATPYPELLLKREILD